MIIHTDTITAIEYAGSKSKLANLLDITRQSLTSWGQHLPQSSALKLFVVTEGLIGNKRKHLVISQAKLKKRLHYNEKTGIFTWTPNNKNKFPNKTAGSICTTTGYNRIDIEKSTYGAHQLAFLYVLGYIPINIDHIDRNRSNNKWVNLRRSTPSINAKNRTISKNHESGCIGVYFDKAKDKWISTITINKKRNFLGAFTSKKEAIDTREKMNEVHGFTSSATKLYILTDGKIGNRVDSDEDDTRADSESKTTDDSMFYP